MNTHGSATAGDEPNIDSQLPNSLRDPENTTLRDNDGSIVGDVTEVIDTSSQPAVQGDELGSNVEGENGMEGSTDISTTLTPDSGAPVEGDDSPPHNSSNYQDTSMEGDWESTTIMDPQYSDHESEVASEINAAATGATGVNNQNLTNIDSNTQQGSQASHTIVADAQNEFPQVQALGPNSENGIESVDNANNQDSVPEMNGIENTTNEEPVYGMDPVGTNNNVIDNGVNMSPATPATGNLGDSSPGIHNYDEMVQAATNITSTGSKMQGGDGAESETQNGMPTDQPLEDAPTSEDATGDVVTMSGAQSEGRPSHDEWAIPRDVPSGAEATNSTTGRVENPAVGQQGLSTQETTGTGR